MPDERLPAYQRNMQRPVLLHQPQYALDQRVATQVRQRSQRRLPSQVRVTVRVTARATERALARDLD